MKKFVKFVKDLFSGKLTAKAVDLGLVDLSGQGRNKYGK